MKSDPGYRDLANMMEIYPLKTTLLQPGSFSQYAQVRHDAGLALAQQRPVRMNAAEDDIQELLGLKTPSAIPAVQR
jgi:hypothetical protein